MPTLAEASLSEVERRPLERIVGVLDEAFGERLRSVWLYGSRARGEPPRQHSDVDLLVAVEAADWEGSPSARRPHSGCERTPTTTRPPCRPRRRDVIALAVRFAGAVGDLVGG